MKTYLVIGFCENLGEKVLFSGSKSDCIDWIWDNCDIGDLYRINNGTWSGMAYFDEKNETYSIPVDTFYR